MKHGFDKMKYKNRSNKAYRSQEKEQEEEEKTGKELTNK